MSPRLLLVDALNLIRRVYAGQPGEEGAEKAVSARASSARSLLRALRQCAPTHALCVFDGDGSSWRHEIFPEYKQGHAPMPAPLAETLDSYRLTFGDMGVASLVKPQLEADDVVATIATKAANSASVTILSTDKIFLSLLPIGVRVRDHFKGEYLDARYVQKRFGVRPDQLTDFLALAGDRGNNITVFPESARRPLESCWRHSSRWIECWRRQAISTESSANDYASTQRLRAGVECWSRFSPIYVPAQMVATQASLLHFLLFLTYTDCLESAI